MSRYEIFRSDNLTVYLNGGDPPSPTVLIAFDHWRPVHDDRDPGFAEEFAISHAIDVIYVRCQTNAWWQYPEMADALAVIAGFAADWSRVITYGSSMGGYAALRYADMLGAAAAIAISPQYSIDPATAPWEHRYDEEASAIDFIHDPLIEARAACRYIAVFDPINPWDARHIERIKGDIPLEEIKFPLSGHPSFDYLNRIGLVSPVALALIEGSYDHRHFTALARAARRSQPQYWFHLTWMLEIHGHIRAAIDTGLIHASMQDDKPAAYAKAVRRLIPMGQRSFAEKLHLVPEADRALLLEAARSVLEHDDR